MKQYQECLYLFESISHGDSKYGYEIIKKWYFSKFWDILELSFAHHACHVLSVNFETTSKLTDFPFSSAVYDPHIWHAGMLQSWQICTSSAAPPFRTKHNLQAVWEETSSREASRADKVDS